MNAARVSHRLAVLLAALLTVAGARPGAAACAPGSIGTPASFETRVHPALAEDVDPAPDVVEVHLTAAETTWDFGLGATTAVWAYNGVIPGPTIEAEVGDTLVVHLCNDLPEPTTIHWHGLETPANMDGSHIAQLTVPPGGTFRYEFPLLVAGTFWYHPHVRTHVAVERGLHGMVIVRDPLADAALGLPEREHLLVLDDVLLEPDGQIREPFAGAREDVALEMLNGREGNLLLLNGFNEPTLMLEKQVPHRLRILNASSARFARLSVANHLFWRIGGDQGLIEEPIEVTPAASGAEHPSDPDPTTGLLLTPGERADILFFPKPGEGGATVELEWHDTQRGRHNVVFNPDGTVTLAHDVPDGSRSALVYGIVQLVGDSVDPSYTPPTALTTLAAIDTTDAQTLALTLGHTIPDWNTGEVAGFIQDIGKPFPLLTADDVYTVRPGETYIWSVKNLTGGHHNFHTHGWSFQHIDTQFVDLSDPNNPATNYTVEATHLENKDTILLPRRPGSVPGQSYSLSRFAVTFRDSGRVGQTAAFGKTPTASRSGGWLAHCHILEHAARGMGTYFQITEYFSDDFETGDTSRWSVTVE